MTLPKIILLGKIGAVVGAIVLVGGVAMYLDKDKDTLPEQSVLVESLLKDYKELSEKVGVTEANLLSKCAKPYLDKIIALTKELDNIKKTKQRYLDNEAYISAMSTPIPEPGAWQFDLDGNRIPPTENPAKEEFIPKVGSQPLYLDPSDKPVDLLELYNKLIQETEEQIEDEIAKIKPACADVAEKEKIDCESPCRNYIHKCLSLVPNAGQDLFSQGLESCMNECRGWSDKKNKCILNATNCEDMTLVCGL